jgi:hypothetical protein
MESAFKNMSNGRPGQGGGNAAERSKYQFEADSDDEAVENEIDDALGAVSAAVGRLNVQAKTFGTEIEHQNKLIDKITEKVSFALLIGE